MEVVLHRGGIGMECYKPTVNEPETIAEAKPLLATVGSGGPAAPHRERS
jgi:hypothetical protein